MLLQRNGRWLQHRGDTVGWPWWNRSQKGKWFLFFQVEGESLVVRVTGVWLWAVSMKCRAASIEYQNYQHRSFLQEGISWKEGLNIVASICTFSWRISESQKTKFWRPTKFKAEVQNENKGICWYVWYIKKIYNVMWYKIEIDIEGSIAWCGDEKLHGLMVMKGSIALWWWKAP